MAESMSSPWIRDYLVDVAETYGAQLYNAPLSSGKKKVQLTDFLTYQENSYVWAWISDKDYRVSVRISQDAAGTYKRQHGRNIIDCRFSVVIISNYRPMFSPRPLGPNTTGNTPMSHVSLEIGHVKSVGIGAHLFGNPRDLELDGNMKEWIYGLRQDGGGGNVLKLRKEQELAQNKKELSPPSPPPFSLYAPVSQYQPTKAGTDTAKPKPERPQDFGRVYTKRWRVRKFILGTILQHVEFDVQIVEGNSWKFAIRPVTEEPLNLHSAPHRTPSPTSTPQRQGTPTDWSLSNKGSPVAADEVTTTALVNDDEVGVLPTTPQLASEAEHTAADTAITPDTRSLQPPTPAQRTKRSPLPRSTFPHGSPEVIARSSPLPSEQFPSSPPLPSSSLPPLSSSLPISLNIRKNIQRKVPHPGIPAVRPVPTGHGPVQILVPDSDTSGAGSSQSNSQSQQPSQSQQSQRQLLSRLPAFPSSLAKDFKPLDSSTPREGTLGGLTRRTSKMFAEALPTYRDVTEHGATSTDGNAGPETNVGKQGESSSTRPPVPSAPKIEVLEVGTSDAEEEADQLQLSRGTARTEVDVDAQVRTQDKGKEAADADHEDNHPCADQVEAYSASQSSLSRQPSYRPVVSSQRQPSSNDQKADEPRSQETPKRFASRSSMHSLFSDPLEDGMVSSPASVLPADREEDHVREKARSPPAPSHDAEAWKEPSFLARRKAKGKARAVEEVDVDTASAKTGKKRQRSAQPESPVRKRAKAAACEVRRVGPGKTDTIEVQSQDMGAVAGPSNRPSTALTDATETMVPSTAFRSFKPRLAKFLVDFQRVDLGKKVEIAMVNVGRDVENTLLRTGRIRTLGNEVEGDGSVYIKR